MRKLISACLFTLLTATAIAAPEAPKPKLIVLLVVDQYSSDLLVEYRPMYRNGLARLTQGIVFPNAFHAHATSETCPGHATVSTGTHPMHHGIIANDWQNPRAQRLKGDETTHLVYCAENPGPAGSEYKREVSPALLKAPTIAERVKKHDPNAKVAVVSGKDRSSIMLGGTYADVALWWDRKLGFTTYENARDRIPDRIEKVNAEMKESQATPSTPRVPAECRHKGAEIQISDEVTVGKLKAVDGASKLWNTTPAMDYYTARAALALVEQMDLGRDDVPDLLAVSFSVTDYVGHNFGTAGEEMCAQQIALDETIGWLLTALDGMNLPYAVALTSDHGGVDAPERLALTGLKAERLDEALTPAGINKQLAAQFGRARTYFLGDWFSNDVYLSTDVPARERDKVLKAAAQLFAKHPQVEKVFTKQELKKVPEPTGPPDEWNLAERARASFDEQRSGDLIVLLKKYVSPYTHAKSGQYIVTHGSAWVYDRRVPILLWRPGVTASDHPAAVRVADVVPTIAPLLGLAISQEEIDGRPLPAPQFFE